MRYSEPNGDNTTEFIQKRQDIDRLRELILEGAASELNAEPLNADYFERLRNRLRSQDSKSEILQ